MNDGLTPMQRRMVLRYGTSFLINGPPEEVDYRRRKISRRVCSIAAGAAGGGILTSLSGLAAVGAVGKGISMGAPAGPIGMALGALIGAAFSR